MTPKKAFKRINEIIFAKGVQLGSDDYFEIRKICCEQLKQKDKKK